MDDVIKELLRSPEGRKLFKQREEPPPAKGKAPAKKATKTGDKDKKGTWANACLLQRRLIFRLAKYAGDNAEACELRRILKKCRRLRRCASPACPKCTYAAQALWAMFLLDFKRGGTNLDKCITIIARGRILPDNPQGIIKVRRFRARLDKAFDEAVITIMLGAFDFDVSEFPDGEHRDHCRPHFHGLALSSECKKGHRAIRRLFQRQPTVHKPVLTEDFDGNDRWRYYTLKIPDTRKVRRGEENGEDGQILQKEPDYRSLRVEQHLQQALLLHELGWSGRFYLRGAKFEMSELRGWMLVRT